MYDHFLMRSFNSFKGIFVLVTVLLFTASVSFFGCDTREEQKPEDSLEMPDTVITDTTQPPAADTTQQEAEQLPDMTGTWTGTVEGRNATFTIDKQDGKEFSGSMSISYREQLNKTVAGTFNFEENKLTMRDTQKFRYAGTYSGKITDDNTKMSGTFTITADNLNVPFSFTKK